MPILLDMIKPDIPALKTIEAAFEGLTTAEQQQIEARLDKLFSQGIPLELKTDKILYIQLFSLLFQLEVIALQIPLRFGPKMKTIEFQQQMRSQLVDEIFHCLLFAKVLNHLCMPHAYFPAASLEMEAVGLFILAEENPTVALVLLNLIGEAWTELLFSKLVKYEVAPTLLEVVNEDEARHTNEALIYSQMNIDIDDTKIMMQKCHQFEPIVLNLFQYDFLVMAEKLIGFDAIRELVSELDARYKTQLKHINLKTSPDWDKAIILINQLVENMSGFFNQMKPIPLTPLRKVQMVMWSSSAEATMTGQFGLDVSDLDLFAKKFPAETLTSVMVQTTSLVFANYSGFQNFLSFNKMYHYQGGALVGLVVKLPGCGDHLATIVIEDAHLFDIRSLSKHIRDVIEAMVFCYHSCRRLEREHPELALYHQAWLKRLSDPFFPSPLPTGQFVSLSNIGITGVSSGTSPLTKNEAMKFTLLRVEKKQVWDKEVSKFVIKDILPVCVSVDHRVFDANIPIQDQFQESFSKMFVQVKNFGGRKYDDTNILGVIKRVTSELNAFPGLQYQYFSMLQTLWPSFMMNNQKNMYQKIMDNLSKSQCFT